MRNKVLKIAESISEIVSKWSGVEAIILGEAAEIEVYDPYFSIDIEVFYRGHIPPRNDRRAFLSDLGLSSFECSPVYPVDRFLVDDLPVRVEYTETARIELILDRIEKDKWVCRKSGTVEFYKITHSDVLFKLTPWIDEVKKRLSNLPDSFWKEIINVTKCGMMSALSDIGAAAYRKDNLFFLGSLSSFVGDLVLFVFAVNKEFSPGGRMVLSKIMKLARLPEGFEGRFESLLRLDGSLDLEKKYEIAELIVKSVIDWS